MGQTFILREALIQLSEKCTFGFNVGVHFVLPLTSQHLFRAEIFSVL